MYLLVDSGIFSSLPRNANHNAGNGVQIVCDRGKDLSAFAATSICSRSSLQSADTSIYKEMDRNSWGVGTQRQFVLIH